MQLRLDGVAVQILDPVDAIGVCRAYKQWLLATNVALQAYLSAKFSLSQAALTEALPCDATVLSELSRYTLTLKLDYDLDRLWADGIYDTVAAADREAIDSFTLAYNFRADGWGAPTYESRVLAPPSPSGPGFRADLPPPASPTAPGGGADGVVQWILDNIRLVIVLGVVVLVLIGVLVLAIVLRNDPAKARVVVDTLRLVASIVTGRGDIAPSGKKTDADVVRMVAEASKGLRNGDLEKAGRAAVEALPQEVDEMVAGVAAPATVGVATVGVARVAPARTEATPAATPLPTRRQARLPDPTTPNLGDRFTRNANLGAASKSLARGVDTVNVKISLPQEDDEDLII